MLVVHATKKLLDHRPPDGRAHDTVHDRARQLVRDRAVLETAGSSARQRTDAAARAHATGPSRNAARASPLVVCRDPRCPRCLADLHRRRAREGRRHRSGQDQQPQRARRHERVRAAGVLAQGDGPQRRRPRRRRPRARAGPDQPALQASRVPRWGARADQPVVGDRTRAEATMRLLGRTGTTGRQKTHAGTPVKT
jgi:hypothetical protein